jgi:hypothetical protein
MDAGARGYWDVFTPSLERLFAEPACERSGRLELAFNRDGRRRSATTAMDYSSTT